MLLVLISRRLQFKDATTNTYPTFDDIVDIGQLQKVPHIKSIPLYENLIENDIMPDENQRFSMTEDSITPLPVGLDFQLLSVNSGMYLKLLV